MRPVSYTHLDVYKRQGIAIGIFPLLVLAAVFNKLTLSVLKGYVFALMWLQSWPMLYAILNLSLIHI